METPSPEYTSFLIRLWREPPASVEPSDADAERFDSAHHEWVAQVEHIPSGEKRYFSSLEDLFAFIREQAAGLHVNKGNEAQRNSEVKRRSTNHYPITRRFSHSTEEQDV